MEQRDEELIAQLVDTHDELRRLVEEHRDFERQLEELNRRPYLTTEETVLKKEIQKRKLAGKDRIEQILAQHREK